MSEPNNPDDALNKLDGLLSKNNDDAAEEKLRREQLQSDWSTLLPLLDQATARVNRVLEKRGHLGLSRGTPMPFHDNRYDGLFAIAFGVEILIPQTPGTVIPVVIAHGPLRAGLENVVYVGGSYVWWEGAQHEMTRLNRDILTTEITNATRWALGG